MDLSNLKPAEGATKKAKKRLGRGQASGKGGTSTRGHKGAKSRSGYSRKYGFEGGQMPIQKRVPKRGFKNINRKDYYTINLARLQEIVTKHDLKELNTATLKELGIVPKSAKVKILGSGNFSSNVNVTVDAYTTSAKEGIEKAGGSANLVD
ncbi:MAG: 50S ribosomal protein L15 [Saprospiraceae bacterium]|nr:50S ribosomal protein L15 [Saprospiraceae bacterium]